MASWQGQGQGSNKPGVLGNVLIKLLEPSRPLRLTQRDCPIVRPGQLFCVPWVNENAAVKALSCTGKF